MVALPAIAGTRESCPDRTAHQLASAMAATSRPRPVPRVPSALDGLVSPSSRTTWTTPTMRASVRMKITEPAVTAG